MLPCNSSVQLTGSTSTVYALGFVAGSEVSYVRPTAVAAAVPDSPVATSPVPFTANCPVTFQSRPGQKLRVSLYSFGSRHDDVRPTASDVQPLQLPQTVLTAPAEQQHDVHAACPVNINVIDGQSAGQVPNFSGDICRLPRLRERHLYITNGTTAHVYINDVVIPKKQYQLTSSYRRWNFILKLEGMESVTLLLFTTYGCIWCGRVFIAA